MATLERWKKGDLIKAERLNDIIGEINKLLKSSNPPAQTDEPISIAEDVEVEQGESETVIADITWTEISRSETDVAVFASAEDRDLFVDGDDSIPFAVIKSIDEVAMSDNDGNIMRLIFNNTYGDSEIPDI